MRKIIYIFIILILVLFLYPENLAQAINIDAEFYFSPQTGTFKKECLSTTAIMIDPGTNTSNAANMILNFNPDEIEVVDSNGSIPGTQIKTGNAYEAYADNVVDNTTGQIRLTGFSISSYLSKPKTYAIIKFRSKEGVDSTDFSFEFSGIGDTLDTNIAETDTSDDILQNTSGASYTFEPAQCANDNQKPSITPKNPENFQTDVDTNTQIEVEICDLDSGVDIDSVIITINGENEYTTEDSGNFSYEGNPECYQISLVPDTVLPTNEMIIIEYTAHDFDGNQAYEKIAFNIPMEANSCDELVYVYQQDLEECEAIINDKQDNDNEQSEYKESELDRDSQTESKIVTLPTTGESKYDDISMGLITLAGFLTVLAFLLGLYRLTAKKASPVLGIVYDVFSKKPIAYAQINFYHDSELIKESKSDLEGKYGEKLEDGNYKVEFVHNNYRYYSKDIQIQNGKILTKNKDSSTTVGLTPLGKNSLFDIKYIINRYLSNGRKTIPATLKTLYLLNTFLSIFAILLNSATLYILILSVNLGTFLLIIIRNYFNDKGKIINTYTELGIPYTLIRVLDSNTKLLVDNQITDSRGNYSFDLKPGKYLIDLKKQNYQAALNQLNAKSLDNNNENLLQIYLEGRKIKNKMNMEPQKELLSDKFD